MCVCVCVFVCVCVCLSLCAAVCFVCLCLFVKERERAQEKIKYFSPQSLLLFYSKYFFLFLALKQKFVEKNNKNAATDSRPPNNLFEFHKSASAIDEFRSILEMNIHRTLSSSFYLLTNKPHTIKSYLSAVKD